MRFPNQIFLELTRECDYRCSHCFADAEPGEKSEIPFEQLTTFLDQIYDMGIIWVSFTGGEPLLRKDILKILDYTKKYGEIQIYTLLTNGTLLNPQFLDKCLQYQKEFRFNVQIGLDGYNYETFSRQRGGTEQQFDTIIRNIRFLKEQKVDVTTFFAVSDKTIGHALDTARFALFELGVDQFLLAPLFIAGRSLQNYQQLEYQYEQWRDLLLEVTDIKKHAKWGANSRKLEMSFFTLFELVVPLEESGRGDDLREVWQFDLESFSSKYRKVFCEAGWTDLCIDTEGLVYGCVPAIHSPFVAGDLNKSSLKEIWTESETLNWFREMAPKIVSQREPCCDCTYRSLCAGGCRLSAFYLTGDRLAPDPRCPLVRRYNEKRKST